MTPAVTRRRRSWFSRLLKEMRHARFTAWFGVLVILAYAILALFAPQIAPYNEATVAGQPYMAWGGHFLLGTDQLGRDVLSRLIYGARNTVGIAVITTCLAFLLGGTLGIVAALYGGWLDQLCSRIVDVFMSIPSVIFALLFLSAFGSSIPNLIVTLAALDATRVFDDLASAVADLNFIFATTARERDGFKPVRGPVEAGRALRARTQAGQRTGILFGRERFGLYNDEVGLADEIVTFPVDPGFSSLNIAQAVLLMSYEWMKSGLEDETKTNFSSPEMQPATKEQLHGLFAHLEAALEARGYFRPAPKKPKMVDNLRAVLTRAGFAEPELKVLRGVVASLDYFSPKEPRGAGYPERKAKADRDSHKAAPADDEDVPRQGGKGTDND